MEMAHETEIIIPGSFTCLQGCPGDGLSNYMSAGRLPKLPRDSSRIDSEDGNEALRSDGVTSRLGQLDSASDGNGILLPTCPLSNSTSIESSPLTLSPDHESLSIVTNDRK